jgi:hypothetical protein
MSFDKVSCVSANNKILMPSLRSKADSIHAYEAHFLQGFLNNNDSAYTQNNGFLDRAQLLMQNLLNQDCHAPMLKS